MSFAVKVVDGGLRIKAPEQKKAKETFRQWSVSPGGSFSPVGSTVGEIDAGYYDITASNDGKIFFVPVRPRTDDLVLFTDSASIEVLKGIGDFWEREERFARYGLPHKRGVLLYGPPGSGKSCTLQLVARDVVERGGIVINFPGNSELFIGAYRALRDIQPETPVVVLMEDFEVILNRVDESRLLNLLDGVEHLSRVVFLATTNYPEVLKERIINRPSRFDLRIRVGHPSENMRRQYMSELVLEGDEIDIEQYVTDAAGLSLSHLKELFVSTHILGNDYHTTLARLKAMGAKVSSFDLDAAVEKEPTGSYF